MIIILNSLIYVKVIELPKAYSVNYQDEEFIYYLKILTISKRDWDKKINKHKQMLSEILHMVYKVFTSEVFQMTVIK
jgi:hypothetical protein